VLTVRPALRGLLGANQVSRLQVALPCALAGVFAKMGCAPDPPPDAPAGPPGHTCVPGRRTRCSLIQVAPHLCARGGGGVYTGTATGHTALPFKAVRRFGVVCIPRAPTVKSTAAKAKAKAPRGTGGD